jgi:hypothetical protein
MVNASFAVVEPPELGRTWVWDLAALVGEGVGLGAGSVGWGVVGDGVGSGLEDRTSKSMAPATVWSSADTMR